MEILWLGQPECNDHALVGGKAANLSRLAATQRVPPGFALTTMAFDQARQAGFFRESSEASSPSLPPGLSGQLSEAYKTLADISGSPEPSVAVRSSAADEDGSTASFAGQHDSFLNVAGATAVAEVVTRCWASASSPTAQDYRRRQGLQVDGVKMAVLVQLLVHADVSAVVFGANPVTGDRDQVVVNASWGLGESVVGGTVTPDTWVVNKADMTVVSREVATKERMTVQVSGGTQEVDVPRLLQTQPAIVDEQAVEMASLAVELERKMGWPVDVECAYDAGELYLLQCRPVTTLGPA